MDKPLTWRIGGDLGDAIFSLALMHAKGGKHDILCVDRAPVSPFVPRVPLLKRLFESQSYVASVQCSEARPDVDITRFRRYHSATTTLVGAQASEYQMQTGKPLKADGSEPWMTVEPDKSFEGKIIVARSPRYNNGRMPWRQIVDHYGPKLIFVGLPQEHATFCEGFGRVPHLQVKDFYELAQAIAGASLCIMNQSSPHAVALALGVDLISEVCSEQPDCIYKRHNVTYVCDGEVSLPNIGGSGELYIPPPPDIPPDLNTSIVPPGMWQYPDLPACNHFSIQQGLVAKLAECTMAEAHDKLVRYNVLRAKGFFAGTENDAMGLFKRAHANAFADRPLEPLHTDRA